VYLLAKVQLHALITYRVSALHSSNNRKINLYSKYRENKLQRLSQKMVVTYKQKLRYRATIFAIALIMNRGMDYWLSFSFTHPSLLHLMVKFMKKNRSCTNVLT